MIQRIQSIFLLIVVILSSVLFFVDIASFPHGAETFTQDVIALHVHGADGNTAANGTVSNNYHLATMNGAIAVIALITIFLFRNRKRQMLLGNLNMLVIVAMIVLIFLSVDKNAGSIVSGQKLPVNYQAGAYLPVGMLIFTFLANRFIKKDEDLVRSADRIR
jgi:glucan phosphoethanolaminetransferase (alkaline phosphatase superfamily)